MNVPSEEKKMLPVIREENLAAPARDGVLLRADAYRPDAPGPFPVLLCRTPYNKERNRATAEKLAERGYLVVVQDVRGRYASDGEFRPGFFSADHSDAEDGHDAVEWAARLPGSTGKVGTFGASYEGWTQWAMAHTRPPHLTAMMPGAIAASLLDRELSGVLRLGRVLDWTVNNLSVDTARRLGDPYKPRTQDEARRLWLERDRLKWLWYLPLWDIPDGVMPGMGPHWRRWLEDHATDTFRFLERHREVNVPALSVTGWYDQQIGTVKHFTGMVRNGMTEHARRSQRLIIGPWTHTLTDLGCRVGDVDFGPEAGRDYFEIADRWYAWWLKGQGPGLEGWPPVQVFVMGANRWRSEDEWPLAGTVYTDFHLHGQGLLSRQPPGQAPPDAYDYDPRDPVMTLYTPAGQHAPLDQRPLDGRRDVLTYATPPLDQALTVIGPVTVRLWAASSARDTDFVVKLMDVWPDGFVQELCHGIVRARYRDSFDRPSPIEPGRPYEYTLQVNPTGNRFGPGHRIRLDVSSSDFPNFDRNHNTGGDDYRESALQTARQTIFHDPARPSRLILPVIP